MLLLEYARPIMGKAKQIRIKPISAEDARACIKRLHYSGKVVNSSSLHIGVFFRNTLEGALQFGSPIDKRKVLPLVEGTHWKGMLELNRMAFSEKLPRNSESRAIAFCMRLIKKHYPHIDWILSFADATQCGDGTIYRASGFDLIGIKKNTTIWEAPDGTAATDLSLRLAAKVSSMKSFVNAGYKKKPGFQIRYIYFLNKKARERLSVPILPFSDIEKAGASMYKGKNKRLK